MKTLISIFMAICLNLYSTGFGQVSKNDVSNYLVEKKIIDSSEIFLPALLKELNKKVLDDAIKYYDYIYEPGLVKKIRVGYLNDNVYVFPVDFNMLLNDLNKHDLTKEQSVLTLMDILMNEEDTIESKHEIDKVEINIKYQYEIITWSKINGIRSRLYFTFRDGKINSIRGEVIDVFVGDYEYLEDISIPGKGKTYFYNLIVQP
jgi:hypothetical protein